ncbi:MAG: thiamine diphosphokinase [Candidatus Neptunochlamydia sp.]|nr:thiamine diphosphokinase [Candidatus Neptunochlamydia sp.]
MIEKLFSSYRSALILNGKKPSYQLLKKIRDNIPIVATDGAAQWCSADYIVGDMDSFSPTHKENGKVIHISDQYTTDFEKAMIFAKEKNLLPCLVMGLSGGEVDHFLGNIQALLKHTENHSFFFLDEYEKGLKIGIPLSIGKYPIKMKIGAIVSIFPHCNCTLTTKGLLWELKDQLITPDGQLAIRNQSKMERVEFNIIEGKALIVIDIGSL